MYFTDPEMMGSVEDLSEIDYLAVQQQDVLDLAATGTADAPIRIPTLDELRRRVEGAYDLEFFSPTAEEDLAPDNTISSNATLAPVVRIEDGLVEPTAPVALIDGPMVAPAPQTWRHRLSERVRSYFEKPELSIRSATAEDIDALVAIDMKAFERVYRGYGLTDEELRADLHAKFTHRFNKVGPEWIQILEKDGKPGGFIMCCPTNKQPEDFESWEKTTDEGTLETTYDPNGANLYIVSLSMTPEASAQNGQDMLFANILGRVLERGMDRGYFESRLPGLRTWVKVQTRREGRDIDALTADEQMDYATRYFNMTTTVNGKEVPRDRLIRLYTDAGCEFVKVVPNAYRDEPSMNFGAVGVYENPMPKMLRNNVLVRKIVGKTVQFISRSQRLTEKVL
jgi:hypothetical protein